MRQRARAPEGRQGPGRLGAPAVRKSLSTALPRRASKDSFVALGRDNTPGQQAKKAPRTRAAETRQTGVGIGARGGAELLAPGAFLGATKPAPGGPTLTDEGGEFGAAPPLAFDAGCPLAPELAVALLLARPRQRATQLARRRVEGLLGARC